VDKFKTFRNIFITMVIGILTAVCGYALRIYLARTYTVAEYGLVYSLIAFFTFVLVLIDLGLSQAVTKKVAELRKKNDINSIKSLFFSVFFFQVLFTTTLSLIFYFYSGFFSSFFFHTDQNLLFKIMILWFWTMPVYFFFVTYFLSYQKTTLWAVSEFFRMLVILILTLILSLKGFGIMSVLIAYGLINIFFFVIFFPIVRKYINFMFSWKLLSESLKYGFFVSIGLFGWVIIAQTDTLIITFFRGLEQAGLYQAALPIASILSVFISPIVTVLFSNLSHLWAKKAFKKISSIITQVYTYLLVILLPLTLTLVVFSNLIINIIFGTKYLGSGILLTILSVAFMISGICLITHNVLSSIGLARSASRIILIGGLISVIMSVLFVHLWGIIGVSFSVLISYLFIVVLLVKQLYSKVKFKIDIHVVFMTALGSILFVATLVVLKKVLVLNPIFEAILCLLGASFIYICFLFYADIISMNYIKQFFGYFFRSVRR
jgi:O-antigen/teichoic acid export membrane protein